MNIKNYNYNSRNIRRIKELMVYSRKYTRLTRGEMLVRIS
jgi:hypothetical protein